MPFEVQGAVALVTGANRGIGKAITVALLDSGVKKVYAAVRNLETVAALVDKYAGRIVPLEFDLVEADLVAAAAQVASDVTLVVNNAGVLRTATALSKEAIDNLKFEMNANVYGLLRVAQAFAPVIKANGGGAIVQLNSVVSMKAFPQFATYCASKAASYSLTQSLRNALKEDGIEVLSVHPGPIATDMGEEAGFTEIAEPPAIVADAIIEGLRNGAFHVFPDAMAKQIGSAYADFSHGVVEVEISEG